jgi:hypothetical protein
LIPVIISMASAMPPKSAPILLTLATASSKQESPQHRTGIPPANYRGQASPGVSFRAGITLAGRRSGHGVGGDAGGVVIGRTGNQPRAEIGKGVG